MRHDPSCCQKDSSRHRQIDSQRSDRDPARVRAMSPRPIPRGRAPVQPGAHRGQAAEPRSAAHRPVPAPSSPALHLRPSHQHTPSSARPAASRHHHRLENSPQENHAAAAAAAPHAGLPSTDMDHHHTGYLIIPPQSSPAAGPVSTTPGFALCPCSPVTSARARLEPAIHKSLDTSTAACRSTIPRSQRCSRQNTA